MQYKNSKEILFTILKNSIAPHIKKWLEDSISDIVLEKSTRKLYLTYTLCNSKIEKKSIAFTKLATNDFSNYLKIKQANTQEIARIYLLVNVLEQDQLFFKEKVDKLIHIADTGELVTFLNYLTVLPNPRNYKYTAVEALRTNIDNVFDAISMDNPFPSLYFNEQQWNQMYLKAAFMQRDLSRIVAVDKMGNTELTRIISDYAHERWAASRTIDPEFWRPVSNFIDATIIKDMERLFKSDNEKENKAAALVCYYSNKEEAKKLLENNPKFKEQLEQRNLTWATLKK